MEHNLSFKDIISTPKRIVMVTHICPDADALGASLGLALFLQGGHHQVKVISPTTYPSCLDWLPGKELVLISQEEPRENIEKIINAAEVICCVDFPTLGRIGELAPLVRNADVIKVLIDHHANLEDFAHLVFWDIKASASAELVYGIIKDLDSIALLDSDIASCLYAGIITDTNSFKNANTTAHTFRVAADLVELGANATRINRLIYDSNSINKLRFIGFAISQRLVVLPDVHTAYFVIQKEDYKRYNLRSGDTDDLVNYARSLKGILLAAVLEEKESCVHLSFRSVGDFEVNIFAKKYFHGGGHRNAAGGISKLTLTEVVDQFERLVRESQIYV